MLNVLLKTRIIASRNRSIVANFYWDRRPNGAEVALDVYCGRLSFSLNNSCVTGWSAATPLYMLRESSVFAANTAKSGVNERRLPAAIAAGIHPNRDGNNGTAPEAEKIVWKKYHTADTTPLEKHTDFT